MFILLAVNMSNLSDSCRGHIQGSDQSWMVLRHFCRGKTKKKQAFRYVDKQNVKCS